MKGRTNFEYLSPILLSITENKVKLIHLFNSFSVTIKDILI